jgi:hypothetical protein
MRVTARDLDLVIGGMLIAVATLLAQLPDPALAIALLGLLIPVALLALGEDALEAMWRAYCREPDAPKPTRAAPSDPKRERRSPRPSGRCTKLAPARVVRW